MSRFADYTGAPRPPLPPPRFVSVKIARQEDREK